MELVEEKILILVVLFVLAYAAGTSPYLLRNRCLSPSLARDLIVSFMNCFAAGVFFATFFMHMMPEAQEVFAKAFDKSPDYPFAELIVCLGFFFVMFVEQAATTWYNRNSDPGLQTEECHIIENTQTTTQAIQVESQKTLLKTTSITNYKTLPDSEEMKSTAIFRDKCDGLTSTTDVPGLGEDEFEDEAFKINGGNRSSQDIHLKHEHHNHFDITSHTTIRSFILLFALSMHALFEGLTIGFQSNTTALRSLVVAILIHKLALSFSYGISLVNNRASFKMVLGFIFIFSIMASIGIAVGIGLITLKNANVTMEKIVAVLQSFASGTFVYIIFIEILPHEFATSNSTNPMLKFTCLLVGFFIMAGLQAIAHEE